MTMCVYCDRYSRCIRAKTGCKNYKEAKRIDVCRGVVYVRTANGGRYIMTDKGRV